MPPTFHDPLDLRAYRDNRWKLLIRYRYTTLVFGEPKFIVVRQGFITDLASIPRIVRSLIPQIGRHRGAAVVHDWLYHKAHDHTYTRLQCDRIFLEAMKASGVRFVQRQIMFAAVRLGGWVFFRKARRMEF